MSVSCSVCDKVYASKNSLASHISRYHTKKTKKDSLVSNDNHQETTSSALGSDEESDNGRRD